MKNAIWAIVVIFFIGLKIYNRVPGYDEFINDKQSIQEGQAFYQMFNLRKSTKIAFDVIVDKEEKAHVYIMSEAE